MCCCCSRRVPLLRRRAWPRSRPSAPDVDARGPGARKGLRSIGKSDADARELTDSAAVTRNSTPAEEAGPVRAGAPLDTGRLDRGDRMDRYPGDGPAPVSAGACGRSRAAKPLELRARRAAPRGGCTASKCGWPEARQYASESVFCVPRLVNDGNHAAARAGCRGASGYQRDAEAAPDSARPCLGESAGRRNQVYRSTDAGRGRDRTRSRRFHGVQAGNPGPPAIQVIIESRSRYGRASPRSGERGDPGSWTGIEPARPTGCDGPAAHSRRQPVPRRRSNAAPTHACSPHCAARLPPSLRRRHRYRPAAVPLQHVELRARNWTAATGPWYSSLKRIMTTGTPSILSAW